MARLLRELIRKPSSSNRFIATLTHHQTPPSFSPPPPFCIPQQILYPTDNKGLRPPNEFAHLSKLQIYPSFSIGYFLDPVLANGFGPSQLLGPGEAVPEEGMMWADSVKKKRKRKMNKHKYKKLRKRLRRKTKT